MHNHLDTPAPQHAIPQYYNQDRPYAHTGFECGAI